MGLYSVHLQRYYDAIGADRIQVHLYEDLANNPKAMLARCRNFLGVSPDFETNRSQVLNVTRHPDHRTVHDLLHHESMVRRFAKKIVPAALRGGMRKRVDRIRENTLKPTRHMPPQVRQAAIAFFPEDIELTQDLIDRDLSVWLNA
jgi:hypothetical protein